MSAANNGKVLVAGANGRLGRCVVDHLLDTLNCPPSRVIAASRKPEALWELEKRGVEVTALNYGSKADRLAMSLDGVSRMFFASNDWYEFHALRIAQHRNVLAAAELAGVSHVVYVSMPSPSASHASFASVHAATEEAMERSSLAGWTILRAHSFYENFIDVLPFVVQGNTCFSAAKAGRSANVALSDVGLAAAYALIGTSESRLITTLSGPDVMTVGQIAAVLGVMIGKPIRVAEMSLAGLEQFLSANRLPRHVAHGIASIDADIAAGLREKTTNSIKQLTGREPRHFVEWCALNQAAFTPQGSPSISRVFN